MSVPHPPVTARCVPVPHPGQVTAGCVPITPVTASLPGQSGRHGPLASRLGGPGEGEGLHFCPPAGQGGEAAIHGHHRNRTGAAGQSLDGMGGPSKKWGEGGARRAPCGLSPPCPPPRKPQEGWPGGKKALVLEQKTKHSFLVLGSLPRAGDEARPGRTGLTRFRH